MRTLHWMWGTGILAFGLMVLPASAQQQRQKIIPGPIDNLQDLQDTGKMLFKVVDENNDNQISQKEAIDAGQLVAGGIFFRADTNGDGTLTQEEARAALDSFLEQKPWLKYAVQTAKRDNQKQKDSNNSAGDIETTLFTTFDTNNDKKLEGSELRQGIQTVVQGVFASADTNRDGQLSPAEVNAGMAGAAKTLAQAGFKQADKDGNNALSEQEFNDAMKKPVHTVFIIADLNHDGQISQEEMQRLGQVMVSKIKALSVPEPENSPRNLMQSGRKPSEVASIPNINVPKPSANQPQQTGAAPAPR